MKRVFSRLFLPVCALLLASCGAENISSGKAPETDAALAYSYAEKSVSFGNRPSGSEAIAQYAEWIRKTASESGKFKVSMMEFEDVTPGGPIRFRNIIAEIKGRSENFVIVGAHYDGKKFLTIPDFQAANDGASGAAALLAMIHALQQAPHRPPVGIKFVFFDGEESLYSYTDSDGLHGSRRLAEEWSRSGLLKRCRAMILLDMIGDRDLCLSVPANSSPELVRLLESLAGKMTPPLKYVLREGDIIDDHVPFLKAGVPALDLIDFEYGPGNRFWHTSGDTLDKISGQSMKTVADLTLRMIWNLP